MILKTALPWARSEEEMNYAVNVDIGVSRDSRDTPILFLVLSDRIELSLPAPQAGVLSVERRERH